MSTSCLTRERPVHRRHRYGQAVALMDWLAPRAEAFIAGVVLSAVIIGIFAL